VSADYRCSRAVYSSSDSLLRFVTRHRLSREAHVEPRSADDPTNTPFSPESRMSQMKRTVTRAAKKRLTIPRIAIACIATAVLTSCGTLGSEVTAVDLGYLIYQGKTATLTAPDTVAAGAPFFVVAQTYGNDCTEGVDHDVVKVDGLNVEVDPFDKSAASSTCTGGGITSVVHNVSVTVATTGTATITVRGLRDDPPVGATDNLTTLTRKVVVR
jgi:hypothetical protein